MADIILSKIDVLTAFLKKPVERDYVLPSFPLGKVGILASAGGTGKSFYALQAAFQVAAGRCCNFDLGGVKVKNEPARVLFISLEDEACDIESRLNAIWQYWKDDEERRSWLDDLSDVVEIYGLAGLGAVLIDEDCRSTSYYDAIYNKSMSMPGLRLIIIDTLRRAHDCDENNNGSMSRVLRYFEILAKNTGAAVLLLHHENKGGFGDADAGASAVRGASAIVDNARYVMRLQTMLPKDARERDIDDDMRRFWVRASLEKSNYGPPQASAWLRRSAGGVMINGEPGELIKKENISNLRNINGNGWRNDN